MLGETWTFLNRRVGHTLALKFIDLVGETSRVIVHRVEEPLEDDAWDWLRRHDERGTGVVIVE